MHQNPCKLRNPAENGVLIISRDVATCDESECVYCVPAVPIFVRCAGSPGGTASQLCMCVYFWSISFQSTMRAVGARMRIRFLPLTSHAITDCNERIAVLVGAVTFSVSTGH